MILDGEAVLDFPFRGHRLIEASAGTGKTYTIANLFLKAICEGRAVDRILVVTFTNAATDELRGRIRRRLAQALSMLAGRKDPDPLLRGLCQRTEPDALQRLLRDAINRMDEAAIFTIHGFCQRVLAEYAFHSGLPFELSFVTEEQELLGEVVADVWRRRYYPLPEALLAPILSAWGSPHGLLKALQPLRVQGLQIEDARPVDPQALLDIRARVDEAQRAWRASWQATPGQLADIFAEHGEGLKQNAYKPVHIQGLLQDAEEALANERALPPAKLGARVIARNTRKGRDFPRLTICEQIDALHAEAGEYERLEIDYIRGELLATRDEIEVAYRALKLERSIVTADDLLSRLDQALQGPLGPRLAERLRRQLPVALIDEFQDTDPQQYRIFRTIYPIDTESSGLIMIGDPKQAIYSFRGADLHAYIEARAHTPEGHRYELVTNWRSTPRLLEATNALFARDGHAPFVFDQVPFRPSEPRREPIPEMTVPGEPAAPLELWRVDDALAELNEGRLPTSAGAIVQLMARLVAGHIAHLLAQPDAAIGPRPLEAADVAVLVRSHAQADALREALHARGLGSAYISEQNVFASDEAAEMVALLEAVAEPGDGARLRRALATTLLGFGLQELRSESDDDSAWERHLLAFQMLNDLWHRRGFIAMFYRLIDEFDVGVRLAALTHGERRLTNLLQLAERIEAAGTTHAGPTALLQWLRETVSDPGTGDETKLRLEKEGALVKIMTLHKSKGLQFPVVYLPYMWTPPRARRKGEPYVFHDESGALCLRWPPEDEAERELLASRTERERLAEDLRLLYVGVTRAEQKCYLAWGDLPDRNHGWLAGGSALAYLLHPEAVRYPGDPIKRLPETFVSDIGRWIDASGGSVALRSAIATLATGSGRVGGSTDAAALRCRTLHRTGWGPWRVSSYSALAGGHHNPVDHDAGADTPAERPAKGSVYDFPRGARAGTFLHAVLEHLDFRAPDSPQALQRVARLQRRYGIDLSWNGLLGRWLAEVVRTPLDDQGLTLALIEPDRRLDELGFFFRCGCFDAQALNRLLADFAWPIATPLEFSRMEGMLTGQIDLVFEHSGRYYIADYKSNDLGPNAGHYHAGALARAMASRRYDLQYLIYTIALHRHLRLRLPEYDPERHLGGVFYLFLRGMRGPVEGQVGGGVYATRLCAALIEAVDRLFDGEGEGE